MGKLRRESHAIAPDLTRLVKSCLGWDRELWGILFYSLGTPKERALMLGSSWHSIRPQDYDGAPTRPLLFQSRWAARQWCEAQRARYADRQDCCQDWRFHPIKIHERIRPNENKLSDGGRDRPSLGVYV